MCNLHLSGNIEEEVYVTQPPRFKDPDHPDKVYKVVKALYGLHQAPRAWYETLANYLLSNGFNRGKIDQTLFIKKQKGDILLIQVYVDDIIFGSTNKELCTGFEKLMKDNFQMSSMGELTFFLGLLQHLFGIRKNLWSKMEMPDDVAEQHYRSLIGSLNWLQTSIAEANMWPAAIAEDNGPLQRLVMRPVHKGVWLDRMEKGQPLTSSNLRSRAGQWFEITSIQFIDPPFSRGYTLGSGEDSIKLIGIDKILLKLVLSILVSAVKRMLILPVQVSAVEGDSINTSIKGFIYFFIRFHLFKHSLTINPNSIFIFDHRVQSMTSPKFAETHNVVAFLEKPEESDGFAEIIDFLKASSVSYALTVNPVIYTSCIEQFWATAKVQTVNGVRQIQALVDKKRVIVTESSIRRDLHLDDAEGTDCLPTATIFDELARMGYDKPSQKLTFYKAFFSPQWKYFIHTITQCLSAKSTAWNEFSSSMASLIICLATNQKFNLSKYIFDAIVKHLDRGVKFLMYLRFLQVFINQQLDNMSSHKKIFVNPFHTKKVFANMKRVGKDFSGRITPLFDTMMVQPVEEMEIPQVEAEDEESVPTPSNDPQLSSEDSMQLTDLMVLCTKLQTHVLDLPKAKDAQAKEIAALKKRIQRKVESSEDQESLGAPEDASEQGRSIKDIDANVDVSLVDETQERQDDDLMFDTGVLEDDEMHVEAKVDGKIKAAKPKVVTTAATTTTTSRPKDKGVVVQEPSEFRVPQETQPSSSKDKGKGIMIEPEVPLKRKDQIALDEQIARDIQAKLDAELLEEKKLAKEQQEEANIALIES
ncbi:uncharacterized mitochondrial protein-like protein [Tanacetum coccineum]|uniref:Uncharacterized mitochondrial protein-like protein n=1 Tax=Tanacetum coccineum TaxID=301880 RepID=A0ABQ5GEY7_9ASTR